MKKVTIIGAGRTGRGTFGELYFSEGGFDIAFADIDANLVHALREQGYYVTKQTNLDTGTFKQIRVDGFEVFDVQADREAYLRRLADSEFVAVAVFPSSFDAVAQDLADMIRLRIKEGMTHKAAVIIGGNFVGLRSYFEGALEKLLDADELAVLDGQVALITSKANRKVTFSSDPDAEPLALEGDDKPILPVEDRFFFEQGYEYPSFFQRSNDVEQSMAEKIWSENLLHCSLGFMGAYKGCEYLNDAAADELCADLAGKAWREGRRALEAEFGIPMPGDTLLETMLGKFSSPYFRDRIERVVRQPIRKLGKGDRFLGPALLCLKHGIMPFFILRAAAYGFFVPNAGDEQAAKIEETLGSMLLEDAVVKITGLDPSVPDEAIACRLLVGFVQEIRCLERTKKLKPADGEETR